MWATHGGLAAWRGGSGISINTVLVHDWDTWGDYLDPTTLIGHYFNDKYFGSHSTGSFTFQLDNEQGGTFVKINYKFTAAYTDSVTGVTYYTSDATGDIFEWDNKNQLLAPMEWKSKTIRTSDYLNMGAARVIAEYQVVDEEITNSNDFNATVPTLNAAILAVSQQLGCLNGPTDYTDSNSNRVENIGTLNAFPVNGDSQMVSLIDVPTIFPVVFKLFVNKDLMFQGSVSSDDIFRLPSGYRADTFEVSVSGSARVKAIHLGETPHGLKSV